MQGSKNFRAWVLVHTWSSLLCTVFLLLICLTGLPLVFGDEIDAWLHPTAYANLPPDAPKVNLDLLTDRSRQMYPGQIVTSVVVDDEEPQVIVGLAPSWAAFKADPRLRRFVRFDARTGQVLERSKSPTGDPTFIDVMLHLHRDLFAGLAGELFMGSTAMLFLVALISGVVLYGPFTRNLNFGTVRESRSSRLKWLDLHNLLGVVTLAWGLVVGATGIMNELSTPLFDLWKRTDVEAMLAPWRGQARPAVSELASVQGAFDTARRALPEMTVISLLFPGGEMGSPHHYLLWAKGNTPLTARLFSPVLVDARSDQLTARVQMSWYLRALEVSRPLHFGDYGGLPLKIIWVLLDFVTILVLGSGLYLYLSRGKFSVDHRADELDHVEAELGLEPLRNARA